MKQPARNREGGQRLTRDDLAPVSTISRMAEVGALATAASAMVLGTLNATEHQEPDNGPSGHRMQQQAGGDDKLPSEIRDIEALARYSMQAISGEQIRLPAGEQHAGAAVPTDAAFDPTALTARIAEQIASSVPCPGYGDRRRWVG
jgi:hypothetical protein